MAMIYTVIFSGIIGLLYIITLLFATFDIDAIVNGRDDVNTGNAITNIFVMSCGEKWGELLSWALVVNIFFGGVSSVTITNRTTFALARDKAFPFSEILEQVEPYTQSPVYALLFGMILSAITNLLPVFSVDLFYIFDIFISLYLLVFIIINSYLPKAQLLFMLLLGNIYIYIYIYVYTYE